jgi:hypothetical protein
VLWLAVSRICCVYASSAPAAAIASAMLMMMFLLKVGILGVGLLFCPGLA